MNQNIEQAIVFVFYLIAYGGLVKALFDLYVNGIAKKWQQVDVKIIKSDIEEQQQSDESPSYTVRVNYCYQYKGHNYQSDRIAFGYKSNTMLKIALVLMKKFERGKTVTAYINPKKPRIAVLIAGVRYFHLLNVGVFLVSALFLYFIR